MTKQQCHYCGSRCEDARGNCGACGAPFEDDEELIPWESCEGTAVDMSEYVKPVTAVEAMRGLADVYASLQKSIGEAILGGADA